MKTDIALLALLTASFALVVPQHSAAAEKKPDKRNVGEKTGDTLKKAGDSLKKTFGTEEEKKRPERETERKKSATEEAVYFKGKITNVDMSARQFRATGTMPGVFRVTDATKITKENATAALGDLERGDAVSGTARRTGEDTFQVLTAKVAPAESSSDSFSDRRRRERE
ncbi:MAG: hypothetical protein M3463_03065 [Verrucomicrobiota bacterium]|nr:hypothetical protein [Verrucomicrobiota bacterium]